LAVNILLQGPGSNMQAVQRPV